MTSIATWYDVLGVLPDANRDDICEAWQARRQALQPLRDFAGPAGRGRDIGSSRDADCRHPFLPCRQPISGGLPRRLPPGSAAAAPFSHRVMQAGMRCCKDYIFKMAAESLV